MAGDELPKYSREGLIATGYYRLGIWDDEPADPKQALYDDLDDILATTSQVMLGLTINCARCHDHKLDPIPQKDYYRMLSFFSGLNRFGVRGGDTIKRFSVRPLIEPSATSKDLMDADTHRKRTQQVNRQLSAIERKVRSDFEPVEKEEFRAEAARIPIVRKRVPRLLSEKEFQRYVALTKERNKLRSIRPKTLEMALCVTEIGRKARDFSVLVRGNPHVAGVRVEPGFLSVITDEKPVLPKLPKEAKTSGRRTALAKWIASEKNPLTARVMVNRLWHQYFGEGIVRSLNNFGFKGEPPTHPKLLDWMASELMRHKWRLKPLHRQILLSRAYQMSSRPTKEAHANDPENRLFSHQNMRRLHAEEVRDSILAICGNLNRSKMYGPSIYPVIPKEVLAGQSRPGSGWGRSAPEERNRRSVYIHIKRSLLVPILESFDAADTDFSCPVRFTTTQPTQALQMLNSDFANQQSEIFADDLIKKVGMSPEDQVKVALQRAFQRAPDGEGNCSRCEADQAITERAQAFRDGMH